MSGSYSDRPSISLSLLSRAGLTMLSCSPSLVLLRLLLLHQSCWSTTENIYFLEVSRVKVVFQLFLKKLWNRKLDTKLDWSSLQTLLPCVLSEYLRLHGSHCGWDCIYRTVHRAGAILETSVLGLSPPMWTHSGESSETLQWLWGKLKGSSCRLEGNWAGIIYSLSFGFSLETPV